MLALLSPAEYGVFAGLFGILFLVAVPFGIIVQWRIATKAGFSGGLSLLMLVPFVNFVVLILFAFTEWPIERALREKTGGSILLPPALPPEIL